MKINITGKNIELTDGLKSAVDDKLSKLDKYFHKDTVANVTMSVEKERQKVEVTVPLKGHIIRAEQVSNDMYVSIDLVEDKLVTKKQTAGFFNEDFADVDEDEDEDKINIIKTKRFGIKPMYPEDACVQMELLGHDFFVFMNAETDEVNVVYKRNGNTYGLIEPEF